MSEESEEITVLMPLHPDKVIVDAVTAEAERIYGDTPERLEAVGFFMQAWATAVHARLESFNRR